MMVLPLVLGGVTSAGHAHVAAASVMSIASIEWTGVIPALVHTAGYLLVTGVIAVIVYERVGLRFLRTAWVNLDLIWAVALVVTGIATMLV